MCAVSLADAEAATLGEPFDAVRSEHLPDLLTAITSSWRDPGSAKRERAALAPAAMPMLAPAPKAGPATPALAASALPKASIIPAAAPRVSEKVAPAPSAAPQPTEQGEDRRRQIPALNITGAVYSEVPAQRMLLVNGLVLKQGDSAAPDLILEEIGASASVFSYRGERFRVVH